MSETLNSAAVPEQSAAPAKPKRPKAKSLLMIGEQTNALFESARLARERGEKVGWSASIFPQEIAETLGIPVLYPENHTAGIAARHQADPFLQECEGPMGYSNDLCAYAKLNLAYTAVLNGESAVELPDGGKMVKPDFLLLTNNICNQLTKWYENLARQLDIPVFFKIGQLIYRLRKEKHLTQLQLANQMNVSDKAISKWERGLGCPDVSLGSFSN